MAGSSVMGSAADTRSQGRLRLVVGLGNPGAEYRDTRHNVGFQVIDTLARRLGTKVDRLECNSLVGHLPALLLVKPLTYMNRSGYALACLAERHAVAPEDTLVVLDDVNLSLGTVRLRRGGGPGGHRGLESVVESLRTADIPRLRLGVRESEAPLEGEELVDYVLGPFSEGEKERVISMVRRASEACTAWLEEGIESAMNRYNG